MFRYNKVNVSLVSSSICIVTLFSPTIELVGTSEKEKKKKNGDPLGGS